MSSSLYPVSFDQPSPHLWSIILAGGEGERTRPFIERWLGRHLPKQYCTFVGTRSMLQHTWDRAHRLTNPSRMITVLAKSHQPLVWKDLEESRRGQVVFQPENRDTAAGIFLPLTYVRARDPYATVMLFPSDHFVFPEDQFMSQIQTAVLAAERWEKHLILLGVSPTSLELEYGWIEPGECLGWTQGAELRSVHAFVEKPSIQKGVEVIAKGGLWSTFILTGQVETLWTMGWRCFPDLMERFERLLEVIGTPREGQVLTSIYQDMPRYNFSSTLLQREIQQIGVMELQGVAWSDWGRPERIIETLRKIGSIPRFSAEHLNVADGRAFVEPSGRNFLQENVKAHHAWRSFPS